MSTNNIRTEIRQKSKVNEYIQRSLQSCQQSDTANILKSHLLSLETDSMQSRHIRALIYINECLHAKVSDENSIEKSSSFMTFTEGYLIFLGFSYEQNITMLVNDRHIKKHFRELLLHPKYGLCVYIVKHLQTEYILLRPDSCDYEGFVAEVFSKEKGNEIELINKELVLSFISVMDTEWDKKVLRVFLGLDRSRREIDALGIDSDSIVRDRNMVFGFINSVANVEKEAEQVLFETLNRKIQRIKNDIKNIKQNFQKNQIYGKSIS